MIYFLAAMFFSSLALTWCFLHYALRREVMDIPNHRSSHVLPTPRGGGLAFILIFLISVPFMQSWGFMVSSLIWPVFGGGVIVAGLGFLDDHRHISEYWRLLGYFIAAAWVVYCFGGMPSIPFLGWVLPASGLLNGLAVVYLVWLLNLYNFMDGIDGLAAIEAISVCCSAAFLYWLNGSCLFMGLPLALAGAVTGFLYWNFPPARIFMGDVGSCFLGLVLGALSIQAATIKPQLFWAWLILLGVFIVDATWTLLTRILQGHSFHEAHRDHAYQHAARRFGSHLQVTLAVLAINLVWLLPLAICVERMYLDGVTGLVLAYLPLIALTWAFRKMP